MSEQVQTIKKHHCKIEQEMDAAGRGGDIYDLVGLNLDSDQKGAIQSSMDFARSNLTPIWKVMWRRQTQR